MKKPTTKIPASVLSFIAAMSLALFIAGSQSAEAFEPWPVEPLIGNLSPDFTLKDLNGRNVSLSSFRGNPVLLNFWATWCPYCRKERAHLNRLHEDYIGKDLVIVSISIDRNPETLRKFMEENPAQFTVLYGGQSSVSSTFHVAGLPTSFLIDRAGIIKRKFTGFRAWDSDSARKMIDMFIAD